jgi:hypothetical protein
MRTLPAYRKFKQRFDSRVVVLPAAVDGKCERQWSRALQPFDNGSLPLFMPANKELGYMERRPESRHGKCDRSPCAANAAQEQWWLRGTHDGIMVSWEASKKYLLDQIVGETTST